ncbi:MAG TPA: uroporphyrinogen-III synthase [Polyangiaceae bacterium]|nr:uroporphyrinogen-III synthase [Polyangiaceae bacterium]
MRPLVALLESRMSLELARLVEKHGGEPLCVPAMRECPEQSTESARRLIEELTADRHELVVFMTGVAVSLLFETAEQLGRRSELVAALKRLTTVARGPKPTAALRGFGVAPTLTAREPFTSAELIDALSGLELLGRRVIVLHYGERSETLSETLIARGAQLQELYLYRWAPTDKTERLEELVGQMVRGEIAALAITCQVQFRVLYSCAEKVGLARELVRVLNENMVVGAVGPTCEAALRAHGVRAHVVPENPKMGPLVVALMRTLERRQSSGSSNSSSSILTH